MEYAKKMVLVTPEVFERINQVNEVQPNTLSLLDNEMKEVLGNNNISDYEKWGIYNQILQRYLKVINNTRKPMSLPLTSEIKQQEKVHTPTNHFGDGDFEILESVPKTFRSKAKLLLQKLKRENNIKWDDQGVVFINQKRINNSNITDLLNDIVRPRKTADPNGWQEFAHALKETNTPFELIGNLKRQHYIKNLLQNSPDNSFKGDEDTINSSYESAAELSTPIVKTKKRHTSWLTFRQ